MEFQNTKDEKTGDNRSHTKDKEIKWLLIF